MRRLLRRIKLAFTGPDLGMQIKPLPPVHMPRVPYKEGSEKALWGDRPKPKDTRLRRFARNVLKWDIEAGE